MTDNEVKKFIYRINPSAAFEYADSGGLWYKCEFYRNGSPMNKVHSYVVHFRIPMLDIRGAKFENRMESKFLLRWLNSHYERTE